MNYRNVCVLAIVAVAINIASAQNKINMSGKCGKASTQQSIPAGDEQGNQFYVAQGKCTVNGKMGSVGGKEGTFTEHGEMSATQVKNTGVYVEDLDSGDKVYYSYHTTGTTKGGAFQGGSNVWQITGGTGKMKGIQGSGKCKLTGTSDGGLDYSCTGTYSMSGSGMAKKSGAQ